MCPPNRVFANQCSPAMPASPTPPSPHPRKKPHRWMEKSQSEKPSQGNRPSQVWGLSNYPALERSGSSLFQSWPFRGLIAPRTPSTHIVCQDAFTCSLLHPTVSSLPLASSRPQVQPSSSSSTTASCWEPPWRFIRAFSEFASWVEYGNAYFKAKGNIAKSAAALHAPLSPHFLVGLFFFFFR